VHADIMPFAILLAMSPRKARNSIWPVYGVAVGVGFIISATVGVIVAVAGAVLGAMLWTSLSRGARR
jgi:hypothetical protein